MYMSELRTQPMEPDSGRQGAGRASAWNLHWSQVPLVIVVRPEL